MYSNTVLPPPPHVPDMVRGSPVGTVAGGEDRSTLILIPPLADRLSDQQHFEVRIRSHLHGPNIVQYINLGRYFQRKNNNRKIQKCHAGQLIRTLHHARQGDTQLRVLVEMPPPFGALMC